MEFFHVTALTLLLLFAFSRGSPSSNQSSTAGTKSRIGIENDQVYLVAPQLKNCPQESNCDTLSAYSQYLFGLSNVIFRFLPGTHNISRTLSMTNCENVTLRGCANSTGDDGQAKAVIIACEGNFTGRQAIIVGSSKFVSIEGISFTQCEKKWFVKFSSSNDIYVRSVNMSKSRFCLAAFDCRNVSVAFSLFTLCNIGILVYGRSNFELSHSQLVHCFVVTFYVLLTPFLLS